MGIKRLREILKRMKETSNARLICHKTKPWIWFSCTNPRVVGRFSPRCQWTAAEGVGRTRPGAFRVTPSGAVSSSNKETA